MNIINKKEFDTANNSTLAIHKTLRQWIIHKKLKPGSKINQIELAEVFGVSRTPIVKALQRLETEGLIDNVYQKGYFVHQLTVKEILEIFALREALEVIVINDVVTIITDEQISKLEKLFAPFSKNDMNIKEYWEADQIFHNTLIDLCRNELAKKINEMFQVLNRTYIGGLVRKPAETLVEHKRIIAALKTRNLEEATSAIIEHIYKTKKLLLEMNRRLEKLGIDPSKLPVQDMTF